MNKFLLKIIIFVLPTLIIFLIPIFVIQIGREAKSSKEIVLNQSADRNMLFSFAYNDSSFLNYKSELITLRNPTILTVGSSRVMQLRKEFFKNSEGFINAGGTIKTIGDIERIISNTKENTTILLGIDQDLMLKEGTPTRIISDKPYPLMVIHIIESNMRRIYTDILSKKINLSNLYSIGKESKNIGIPAILTNSGFRSDGSYRYGAQIGNPKLEETALAQIETESNLIKHDFRDTTQVETENYENNLKLLEKIYKTSINKNIKLVVFTPPFPNRKIEAMKVSGSYWKSLVTSIPEGIGGVSRRNGIIFFDFTKTSSFNGSDTEFVDGIHGSDLMYSKIALFIALNEKIVFGIFNISFLEDSIRDSTGLFANY